MDDSRGPWLILLLALTLAGCAPRPANTPPPLFHSSLLTYRPPQPLGLGSGRVAARRTTSPRIAATPALQRRREQLVAAARRDLGQPLPDGPERWVTRTYRSAGWSLSDREQPTLAELQQSAARRGYLRGADQPLPGDLAFFAQTRDQNGNGRLDDSLTHVALVERVDADGTVHLLHVQGGTVRRLLANPQRPHLRRVGAKVINSYLRVPARQDRPGTPYLAGEMLAGFATFLL